MPRSSNSRWRSPGRDQHAARRAGGRRAAASRTADPARRVEPLGERGGEAGGHVLDDDEREPEVGRQRGDDLGQRRRAAGRDARSRTRAAAAPGRVDARDPTGAGDGDRARAAGRRDGHRRARARLRGGGAACGSARRRSSTRSIETSPAGLVTKSTAPAASASNVSLRALLGVRREHHDRRRPLLHDLAHGLGAVHAGHVEVHRDDVGLELRRSARARPCRPWPGRRPRTGRLASVFAIAARMNSESSTISTRTRLMPAAVPDHAGSSASASTT